MDVDDVIIALILLGCLIAMWVGAQRQERRLQGKDDVPHHDEDEDPWSTPRPQRGGRDADDGRYGDVYQAERARWAALIAREGSWCNEPFCVMQTRRIGKGDRFHLSHDHAKGGPRDLLGPSHPECNEHEARLRGVVFERDPDYRLDRSRADLAVDDDPWGLSGGNGDEGRV